MKEQQAEEFKKIFDELSENGTLGWNDEFVPVLSEESAIKLFDAAMKERDEEMLSFAEWCGGKHEGGYFTTAQLLEKFRSKI